MRAPALFRGYAAVTPDFASVQNGEAGSDGDGWLADLMGGGPDINPVLHGRAKFLVYDEMRKTDGTVKSTLLVPKLAIRSGVWGLNPKDENEPLAKIICDYVAENLGLNGNDGWLDLSWDELLQQGLTVLDFGVALEERVWWQAPNGDLTRPWVDANGDVHMLRPLVQLAIRPAKTIERVKREHGRLVEVRQMVPGTKPIPGDKLSHLIWERDGDRWDGISMLRPMWGPWFLKKNLMISAGIGWDRFALGLPVVYHPNTPQDEQIAKSIGRHVRSHERGYVHFPSDGILPNGEPDSKWVLRILNAAATLPDPVPLIQDCSTQIAEAGLQHAMRQGHGQTGARASAQVQIDPLFLAIEAMADYIRTARARQVIHEIVRVNFGAENADKLAPVLTVSKIQARNVEVTANAIALLDQAGITFTDRGAQDDAREMLGFSPLPDDLAQVGIDPAALTALLQKAGLDSGTLAAIVNQLPANVGLARNRVAREGSGLALPAGAAA